MTEEGLIGRVARRKLRLPFRHLISRLILGIPTEIKASAGRLWPYFPIPRNFGGRKLKTFGTPYQLAIHLLGFEDGLATVDEPVTARLVGELRENDVFVDIGANIGLYTLLAATQCEAVIAIEPGRKQFRHLVRNVKLNGLKNVVCINSACWDRETILPLYHNTSSHGWDSLVRDHGGNYPVRAAPLDSLLESLGVGRVKLIKVDTEGAEIQVLNGARRTLQETSIAMIEVHDNVEPEAVQGILSSSGFSTEECHQHGSQFVVARRSIRRSAH